MTNTVRTALVRTAGNNLKVFRKEDYHTNAEFAEDLRGNGFKVLKVWKGYKTEAEIDRWELVNRK